MAKTFLIIHLESSYFLAVVVCMNFFGYIKYACRTHSFVEPNLRVLDKNFTQYCSLRCWGDFAAECYANGAESPTNMAKSNSNETMREFCGKHESSRESSNIVLDESPKM